MPGITTYVLNMRVPVNKNCNSQVLFTTTANKILLALVI